MTERGSIQKRHFEAAARQVKAILDGEWTHEPPEWTSKTDKLVLYLGVCEDKNTEDYTRAVQTVEAYILLFRQFNPLFDSQRFLIACGLVAKPEKKGRK